MGINSHALEPHAREMPPRHFVCGGVRPGYRPDKCKPEVMHCTARHKRIFLWGGGDRVVPRTPELTQRRLRAREGAFQAMFLGV